MNKQNFSPKLSILPTGTLNVSLISKMSTQKQALFTVTPPRHGEAQDLEGGYVTLVPSQNFISTSKTLVQIGM
jgi:hypothetical protein